MNWKTTRFEREKLFEEVWTTPVTTLAKAYGLSDVGLRKICVALDVPLPPRGYWAKLAAGTAIPKPVLRKTTAATTYSRAKYVAQVDGALEERVANARAATLDAADSDTRGYSPPLDPKGFSSQAKLVARAMKSTKIDEGAFTSVGVAWADISASPDLKERALLLVDRFAHELEALGAKFENTHPPLPPLRRGARRESDSKRNCFMLHGHRFFVRIQERITQELAPPPPPKPLRPGARQPEWKYRSPEYRYIATGKLHVSIVDADTYYDSSKMGDSVRATIEDKVKKAVQSVSDAALRRKLQTELRAERELVLGTSFSCRASALPCPAGPRPENYSPRVRHLYLGNAKVDCWRASEHYWTALTSAIRKGIGPGARTFRIATAGRLSQRGHYSPTSNFVS